MITFSYAGHEYKMRNPALNNILEVNQKALFGRTASGVLYRYNKGVKHNRVEMRFEEITQEEKNQLVDAFSAIRTEQFSLIDHAGKAWLAIFTSDKLSFEEISDNTDADSSFYVDDREIISSQRKNARYNVSIELETAEA